MRLYMVTYKENSELKKKRIVCLKLVLKKIVDIYPLGGQ